MDYQIFQSCQLGDVGISIIVAVVDPSGNPVDIRTASAKTIRLGYPDGSSKDFTAGFLTDGGDGQLVYIIQAADLDQVGEFEVQGIIVMGGATKSTRTSIFHVLDNIPAPVVEP